MTASTFSTSFFIVICTKLVLSAAISTQYYGNTKHSVLPLHCYYEELDLAVPVNETLRPTHIENTCIAVSCRDDFVLEIKHCDRIMLPRGCRLTSYDYSKAYPDCCCDVVCT